MKKKRISLLYVLLIALLIFPMQAAADDQIQLDKTFTSFTPVFMSGHEGDLDWIEGFEGTGDIYMGAEKVGTLTATLTMLNPPVSFAEKYEYGQLKVVNTITGMGTFEVHGMALSMGSSTVATDFQSTLAWTGTISNATGSLAGLVGLSSGTASVDMATFTAAGKELLLYRLVY